MMILYGEAPFHQAQTTIQLRDGVAVSRSTYFRKMKSLCGLTGCQCPITWHDESGRPFSPRVGLNEVIFEQF